MPGPLRGFAEHQPTTPIVEALLRALLLDQPMGNAGWLSAIWLTAAVLISVPIAGGAVQTEDRPGSPVRAPVKALRHFGQVGGDHR
ncbi:hypothetical protein GCM10020219_067670 [Nonomuraea dietziae]